MHDTDDTTTVDEALAIVATLHEHTLGVDAATITAKRADAVVGRSEAQTTTELLLLISRFLADVDDKRGSDMVATFAVEFAAYESTVV